MAKNKGFKRLFSLILCCIMILGIVPATAFAVESDRTFTADEQEQYDKQIVKSSKDKLSNEIKEDGKVEINEQVFPTGKENEFEIQLDVTTDQTELPGEASADAAVYIMVDKSSSMNGYSPAVLDSEEYNAILEK